MTQHQRIFLGILAAVFVTGFVAWVARSASHPAVQGAGGNVLLDAFQGVGKQDVEVALLAREPDLASKPKITEFHQVCLQELFKELDLPSNLRLVLRTYDRETLKGRLAVMREKSPEATIYDALLEENDQLVAVIDNTRGSELVESLPAIKNGIQSLRKTRDEILDDDPGKIPVISLNADRYLDQDYGDGILFLGSQTMASTKVARFISEALLKAPGTGEQPMLIFMTETGYGVLPGDSSNDPRYIYEEEIRKATGREFDRVIGFEQGDLFKEVQSPPEKEPVKIVDTDVTARVYGQLADAIALGGRNQDVVVVVNAHYDWGTRIVARLQEEAMVRPERAFRLIGFDPIFKQDTYEKLNPSAESPEEMGSNPPPPPTNFEMILLKIPNPEFSKRTYRLYQKILEEHPDLISLPKGANQDSVSRGKPAGAESGTSAAPKGFPREVASIFILRCAVATELLNRAVLENRAVLDLGNPAHSAPREMAQFSLVNLVRESVLGFFREVHENAGGAMQNVLSDAKENLRSRSELVRKMKARIGENPDPTDQVVKKELVLLQRLETREAAAKAALKELEPLANGDTSVRELLDSKNLGDESTKIVKANQGYHLELSDLGLVHFNSFGEEDGSHYFELHQIPGQPMAHLKQLSGEDKLIPALEIGINNFQIRRVDEVRGEFDAEFICSTTISSSLMDSVLREMKEIREEEEIGDLYPEGESVTGDPRGRLVEFPMLSGLLSIPNMRANGSVAQIGQTDTSVEDTEYRVYKVRGTFAADIDTAKYPFDSQEIGVELQAAVPDRLLTLATQKVEETHYEPDQRGWKVKWINGLVDNRVANGNPLAAGEHRSDTHQFKEFAIMVGVSRDLSQPMLVVMLPLVLLGFAAIAIMFVRHKGGKGKSPSELAVGVVLAVVAYSISYAEVVPRSGGQTHSDWLYLCTILICMGNFGAVLFFWEFADPKAAKSLDRWRVPYAVFIAVTYALFLVSWRFGLFWETS